MTDSQFEYVRTTILLQDQPPADWREILSQLVEEVVYLRLENKRLESEVDKLEDEVDDLEADRDEDEDD